MRGIMPGSSGPFPLSCSTGPSTTVVHLSGKLWGLPYSKRSPAPLSPLLFGPEALIGRRFAGFLVVAHSGLRPVNSIRIAILNLHPCLTAALQNREPVRLRSMVFPATARYG